MLRRTRVEAVGGTGSLGAAKGLVLEDTEPVGLAMAEGSGRWRCGSRKG